MSTISRRISTSIKNFIESDFENALIQVCIAIDATARKKGYGKKNAKRIKKFIGYNEAFIYKIATSGALILSGGSFQIQGKKMPEIIYKLIRCTLLHGDELENYVLIKEGNNQIGIEGEKIIINTGHIFALILTVILDYINRDEFCDLNHWLRWKEINLRVNELWGDESKKDIFK